MKTNQNQRGRISLILGIGSYLVAFPMLMITSGCNTSKQTYEKQTSNTSQSDGLMGQTGIRGERGSPGPADNVVAGNRSTAGEMGATRVTGKVDIIVENWTSYCDLWFNESSYVVGDEGKAKIKDIAEYLHHNPSLEVGIDGSTSPTGSSPKDQNLADRRIRRIRNALVSAGVQDDRIKSGSYGDPSLLRDRRVEVLVRTIQ